MHLYSYDTRCVLYGISGSVSHATCNIRIVVRGNYVFESPDTWVVGGPADGPVTGLLFTFGFLSEFPRSQMRSHALRVH